MGLLIEGQWRPGWYDTHKTGGRFIREDTRFHDRVSADGTSGYKAEPGRYHLYVSLACPWAHRTLIFRRLKGLDPVISLSVVDPFMGRDGWHFSDGPGCIPDTVNGCAYLHQVYTAARPDYSGRVTVPVLWDKHTGTIVNNESAEIIRIFNTEFNAFTDVNTDFYPPDLRPRIDAWNERIYETVNNGVYKAGFATTQAAYEEAFDALFNTLDELETVLGGQRYLAGDVLTEADWRLFTTLVRFDGVYYGHFKCNQRRVCDYRNLWAYVRELYQMPGIAQTVDLSHIKRHYYQSHDTINPTRIVPKGPALDFTAPHDRDRIAPARRPAASGGRA